MKRIILTLVLVIGCTTFDVGCRHVNSTNPKVIQAVRANDLSKTCKTISDSLLAADKTLDAIQTQEPDYYAHVKPWLVKIAKANDVAIANVAAYDAGTITFEKVVPSMQSMAAIAQELDPTTFGFKNPKTQQDVKVGFELLQATLASVIQQFGTK